MNKSPGRLLSELTASIRATRKRVPAGMTVFGSGFGSGFTLSKSPEDLPVESALVVEGCVLHPIAAPANAAANKR